MSHILHAGSPLSITTVFASKLTAYRLLLTACHTALRAFCPRDAAQAPALVAPDDKPRASSAPATARMPRPLRKAETVVEGEFFSGCNVPPRHDPDSPTHDLNPAIR